MNIKNILQLLVFIPLLTYANAKVLYQENGYTFTEKNAKELIVLAEYLAGSEFTKQDKKNMMAFSIKEFKSVPRLAVSFYKSLSNYTIPTILSPKTSPFYRVRLFLHYWKNVSYTDKSLKNDPGEFLNVIFKYNPPINEALLLNQYYFYQIYYSNQMNQYYFNQIINSYTQSSQAIINSISDTSTRQSIYLSGGTILADYGNSYLVQYENGSTREVSK